MPIIHHDITGLDLYARVRVAESTFVAEELTEGSSGGLGVYELTDANLLAAGLTAPNPIAGYTYSIRQGEVSTTDNDPIHGVGVLLWDGEKEVPNIIGLAATTAVDDGTITPTTLVFAGGSELSADDDFYVGSVITWVSGALRPIARRVVDYDGSDRQFTVAPALPDAPAAGDQFVIIGRID
jgi:hypothetical protein